MPNVDATDTDMNVLDTVIGHKYFKENKEHG